MSDLSKNNPSSGTEPKKSSKVLIIVVATLAVLLVAALVINFMREKELKQRNADLMVAYSSLDSIGNEMKQKIFEIEQLGGNVEELIVVRREKNHKKIFPQKKKHY